MNWSMILFGILPLLAFVVIDSVAGLKAGLVAAVVIATAELIFSLVTFGEIDNITLFSFFLVGLMAMMAYRKESTRLFLLQPVILSFALGLYFVISYALGHPVFLEMMTKYREPLMGMIRESISGEQAAQVERMMASPAHLMVLEKLSLTLSFGLFAHGLVTWWAAIKLSKWWWLLIRGVGFYVFLFLTLFATQAAVYSQLR